MSEGFSRIMHEYRGPLGEEIRQLCIKRVSDALDLHFDNKTQAAAHLGISVRTLRLWCRDWPELERYYQHPPKHFERTEP